MPTTFRIPKQSDRTIHSALQRVRARLAPLRQFKLYAVLPHRGAVAITDTSGEDPSLGFVFEHNAPLINFYLRDPNGRNALNVQRHHSEVTDAVELPDNWAEPFTDDQRQQLLPQLHLALLSVAREELKASDIDSAFGGSEDTSWNRYKKAQAVVVDRLERAAEELIVKTAAQNADLDRARSERFEKLEAELRNQLTEERQKLQATHDERLDSLRAQEKALADKESAFNTRESHYVARQKQTEQIQKIQSWLDSWSLTEGTRLKRRPIFWAYVAALILTAALTAYATWHSYELLKNVDEIVKLAWWQWAGIWAKSFFPLAAFVTFMIYFIRWSGDWARQHSEEEFRNRTRLIDIGRSSWLLEAVRDAQARNKEIPPDLLRELSRNLFATNMSAEKDIHPQAAADLLLQGLSSLRVKTSDGSEVEAKRDKGK